MSKGREFQIVGAATENLLEPQHVWTRGTDNRLVSDERTSWSVMFKNRVRISRLSGVDGLVCNAGDLESDALVNWKPVIMFEQSR